METFEEPVSCLALRKNSAGASRKSFLESLNVWLTFLKLACTTSKGFAIIGGNSTLSYICRPLPSQDEPHTRFNDGGCDNEGRFFAGTLWNQERGIAGKLYRYDPATGTCDIVDEGPFTAR